MHALAVLAADAAEPSKTPFYIVGGALALWAVILAGAGLSRPEFPGSAAASKGVMAFSTLLVLGAMAAAVLTS